MRYWWLLRAVAMMVGGLGGGLAGVPTADSSEPYDALVNFSIDGRETRSLLEMSDAQMASVVGGELGNSLQTFGLPSADQLSEQLTRILNQALTARPGDQSKATAVETQSDGTTRIIAQEGNETITIIIPFPISPQTLLSAFPFQSLASVGQNIVQAINELSGPVLGAPTTALRLHR